MSPSSSEQYPQALHRKHAAAALLSSQTQQLGQALQAEASAQQSGPHSGSAYLQLGLG